MGLVKWRYEGSELSPDAIRFCAKTVRKGGTVKVPEDYDWIAEYGSDLRVAFRIVRVGPPPGQLQPLAVSERPGQAEPLGDALEQWQKELKKKRGYIESLLHDMKKTRGERHG